MAEEKMMRLSQVARKLNVGLSTITEYLSSKGYEVDSKPNSKITEEQFTILAKEYASSLHDKEEASSLTIGISHTETVVIETISDHATTRKKEEDNEILIKNLAIGKEDVLEEKVDEEYREKEEVKEDESIREKAVEGEIPKLKGIKVLGKIDLSVKKEKEEVEKEKEEIEEGKHEDIKDEKPEVVLTDSKPLKNKLIRPNQVHLPLDPPPQRLLRINLPILDQ